MLKVLFIETMINTVLVTPRGLIAVIENNYQEDGSILILKPLQPYIDGKEKIEVK